MACIDPRFSPELPTRMRDRIDWESLSHSAPLLAAMPPAARSSARPLDVAAGACLFSRGDRPRAMYYVLAGEVHLTRHTQAGNAIVLQRTRRGMLAEASLDQRTYHCDAVAALPSQLLVFSRRAVIQALNEEHFRNRWIAHLAGELRRVRAHSERLSLRTAPEKIIHYIETEGDGGTLVLHGSKKDWAAELGLTHEALYRTLARMERDGSILVRGSVMTCTR